MATTYISRTPSGAGDLRKWTVSAWVKRGNLGSSQAIISWFGVSASYTTQLRFDSDNTINFYQYFSGYTARLATNRVFRDVGAWYHIVAVWDTDNAAAGDRMKLYVNGVEETSFATDTNPALNLDSYANSANEFTIGSKGAAEYFDGDMSWVQFVDGAALAPTEFGSTDATSGIWKIKPSAYGTPGTNGYCLAMEDRSNLDLDTSSNAHTFTTTGTGTATYDNPSNNFATYNVITGYNSMATNSTFSNGNTSVVCAGTDYRPFGSTLGVSKGKWYAEFKTNVAPGDGQVGIFADTNTSSGQELGHSAYQYCWYNASGGTIRNNDAALLSSVGTYTTNDIIGIAVDCDNNKLYFHKNGTYISNGSGTGNPSSGTYGISIGDAADSTFGFYFITAMDWGGGIRGNWNANFGNGYFGTTAVSSAEADDAGIGAMEYDVPTGYYCLCTKNIKAYGG